jgi:hypothetical protein
MVRQPTAPRTGALDRARFLFPRAAEAAAGAVRPAAFFGANRYRIVHRFLLSRGAFAARVDGRSVRPPEGAGITFSISARINRLYG